MPSYQVTQKEVGYSQVLPLDLKRYSRGVGILITINGNLTASVQVTGDNVQKQGYSAGSGNWNNYEELTNLTASYNYCMQVPVTAVRLNVTAFGNGSVTMSVVMPEG
jgi:hypothetical protein